MEEILSDDDFKFNLNTGDQIYTVKIQPLKINLNITSSIYQFKIRNVLDIQPKGMPEITSRQQSLQQRQRPLYTDKMKSPCKSFYYDVGKNFQSLKKAPIAKLYGSDRFK
ncbi:hypothetical protein SS50377_26795 [Spironucleus salmonicida]|uniref:Uncharacterized protein n=1 Tax=Spironucleus salmonicida TaxID=348837 RepID=V6M765_9EUKA|nr:hypothetical protein SS50377_26795 [Spironucleus salmonicida]|eukprot:EST49264.1 Hypothetical protein SS50377_10485 [Spironucleus salmonicida]